MNIEEKVTPSRERTHEVDKALSQRYRHVNMSREHKVAASKKRVCKVENSALSAA
jgi:hypothetical protein